MALDLIDFNNCLSLEGEDGVSKAQLQVAEKRVGRADKLVKCHDEETRFT